MKSSHRMNGIVFSLTFAFAFMFTACCAGIFAMSAQAQTDAAAEDEYYVLDNYTPPAGVSLEVGGLAFMSDGRLVVSTRRGQVWVVENPLADDPADARFHLFCEGLHEGLGLSVVDDEIYVLQRAELSRLKDTDGDGTCDRIETVSNDWGVSGNYHEFAFGLPRDDDGNFYIGLNVAFSNPWWHGRSPAPYRGWCLKIAPDGTTTPVASGFRSPCGVGRNAAGDIFITDNQGDWFPACPILHVKPDRFYGHPASLNWTKEYQASGRKSTDTDPPERERAPAAVWIPYNWSRSTGNLVAESTNGKFSPFHDQLFVAEVTNGVVFRAALEKVRGEYQGACFMFKRHVGSASRIAFAPDGTMIVGRTNRGWGGQSPASGLGRLRPTGKTPLEIHTVHLIQKGFELRLTKPLANDCRPKLADFDLVQYDYNYWWEYGCPELRTRKITIDAVEVSRDRRTVTVRASGLRAAKIARMKVKGFRGEDGRALLHDEFNYTVNQLPEGPLESRHVAKLVPKPRPKENWSEGWIYLNQTAALDAWKPGDGWKIGGVGLQAETGKFVVTDPPKLEKGKREPSSRQTVIHQGGTRSDLVGRFNHAAVEASIPFFLPPEGRATVYFAGRYGISVRQTTKGTPLTPESNGGILPTANNSGRTPNFEVWNRPGEWHSLNVIFIPPAFDDAGNKIRNARFGRVRIDDTLLHENVELTGPTDGAPMTDEAPTGPLVLRAEGSPVAFRQIGMRTRLVPPDEDGWESIFNGLDLRGWKISDDGQWTVEDGCIVGRGPRSHLFSPRNDYRNLEFRAWVKINAVGNSGMYFRTTFGGGWPPGYEAQINSTYQDPVKSGSLYNHAVVKTTLVNPGMWFKQHITCRDTPDGVHVVIRVNDVVVTDYVDTKRTHAMGHVAFQQHHDGSEVRYRDVQVRELD